MPAERCRNADEDGVALFEPVEIRGGGDTPARECLDHPFGTQMSDVRLSSQQRLWFLRIDVEANHREAGFFKEKGQGKADIAQANDPYDRLPFLDSVKKVSQTRSQMGLLSQKYLVLTARNIVAYVNLRPSDHRPRTMHDR